MRSKTSASYSIPRQLLLIGTLTPTLIACNGGDGSTTPVVVNDAYYAELAQGYEPFTPDPSIGAAQAPEDYISQGRWSNVIDWPEIATGAANLPDGRLMTWASTSKENFGTYNNFTFGSIYDPGTGTFAAENNNFHNTFCAGVSMLSDGRVFAAGGGATITKTSIFDLASNDWALTNELNNPRWYSTTTTLPTGQVLTALGTNVPYSEIWTEGTGWDVRTNLSLQSVINDNSAPASQRNWYPALNVAPDGSLFHAGPTSELFSLYLGEDEGVVSHGDRENGDPFRLYNTTVMYDIGKMLIAGGGNPSLSSAMTVDLNGASPAIAATNSMNHARSMHNSVVLPNGKVMVIGGNSTGIQFSDQGSQLTPELWDPETGVWQELAQHIVPRNYHSTALLMKDARVAALGGGLCGGCPSNHKNGQFYEPPYLFNADGTPAVRPTIINGEAIATVGDVINIQGSSDIVKFNMVRLVALTHHHTTDQRLVPLAIQAANDGYYQLAVPANQNVVIPGYYWIFGLNSAGVPTVGHTIKINVNNNTNTNTIAGTGAVEYEYYEGEWFSLPNFDFLTPKTIGKLDEFNLTPALREDDFAIRFTSKISVPDNGLYTFHTTSDDGSQLFINDQLVVDNNGLHAAIEKQGSILTPGLHDIEVTYFELKGDQSLAVSWSGPGFGKTDINANLTAGLSELQNPDDSDDSDNTNEPDDAAPIGISYGESLVSLEAENYESTSASPTHNWTTTSLFNSSNNAAIVTTPDSGALTSGSSGSPSVEYSGMFDQAGTWYVWLRGWGNTNTQGEGSSDSIHAGLNGELSATADNIDYFPAGWNWSNSTRDGVRASISIPSAGEHKFNLWMREDGLAIDKIVLTTDSTYIPSGSGPAVTSGTTNDNSNMGSNTDQGADSNSIQQATVDANEQWKYSDCTS